MTIINRIKEITKKIFSKSEKTLEISNAISVVSMEMKFENDDLVGAAKELKSLLEAYGRRKRKNHRYKGREFIYFLLSNKHKDLKNIGYVHWQKMDQLIKLNPTKVYPYHKTNLRNAMDFFEKQIKGIYEIKIANQ
jgi:hypothetical protein